MPQSFCLIALSIRNSASYRICPFPVRNACFSRSVQDSIFFCPIHPIPHVPYRISVCHSVQGFWRRVQASGKSYKIYGLRNVQSEGVVMSSSMLRVATKHGIITGRITSNNMFARGRQNNSKPVSLLRKECDTVKQ